MGERHHLQAASGSLVPLFRYQKADSTHYKEDIAVIAGPRKVFGQGCRVLIVGWEVVRSWYWRRSFSST